MEGGESFTELIDRLRRGDASAVDVFLQEYGPAIRREVRFILLDLRLRVVVSESDVCQSVLMRFFVKLWSGGYEFERPSDLVGLLKKMVRCRVADLARRWMNLGRDLRRTVSVDSGMDHVAGPNAETPSEIVMRSELLGEMQKRLSERDRVILSLRQEKRTWAEIVACLNSDCGPEALRKQFERSLAQLCRELGIEE